MRPMQAKYACSRIDQIASEKVRQLEEKNLIPPHSSSEVYEMIKDGVLKLKEKAPKNHRYSNAFSNNIDDYFDLKKTVRVKTTFKEGHQEEVDKVFSEVTKIKDEIWLGDEDSATKLINDFSS